MLKLLRNYLCKDTLQENIVLRSKNKQLSDELIAKGNIFFVEHKWLGSPIRVLGSVVDGEVIVLSETKENEKNKSFDLP